MADINLREYYSTLLTLDPFIMHVTHGISMSRIAELAALKAYMEANLGRCKRMLISKELKKPFLQKLYELKGVV